MERVLNNPYLLADIMRYVAQVDKAYNVLSTLCVSRAFRNPHVIREALRSITYIYKPLRDKVTADKVMSCVDIDHVSGAVERSELKIDGLLRRGEFLADSWTGLQSWSIDLNKIIEDRRIEYIKFESHLTREKRKESVVAMKVLMTQTGAYSLQVEQAPKDIDYGFYALGCFIEATISVSALDRMMQYMNSHYFIDGNCDCCKYIIEFAPRSDLVICSADRQT